jgi:4-amino-4-deoxy-L-arabinose transferase-like glycosyltransferase
MTDTTSIIGNKARAFWPRGLASLVDFASARHSRAVLLLIAVSLAAFLPGFFAIPPVDRDEARFAQATKQMLESGDYVDIRFQGEFRYKKPVGIYWLQAAVVKTAETLGLPEARARIALYRIPSLIGAIGAVLLTYWTALAFASRRAAVLAGLMMATCILLGVEARLAKTDAMLLLTVIAAMGAMARVYLGEGGAVKDIRRRWILPLIFWSALAAGVLIKGPLIWMFVGLTAAALVVADRSARWLLSLRPLIGIPWMLLLVVPWFVLIATRSGGSFFSASVGDDMLAKVVSGQEAHGAPPGFYLVLFLATFWPASILSGLAAPAVWRERREATTRFLLAWLVPSWVVFEIVITKLPHYVLPLYPAIAILIAMRLDPLDLSKRLWLERGSFWWLAAPLLVGFGGIVAAVILMADPVVGAWPFAALAVIFGFRAWWLYDSDGPERALLRACAASVLLAVTIYGAVIPALGVLFPSATLAETLRESGCNKPVAAAVGYQEPSLVFLAGTQTVLTDAAGAADFMRGGSCRFAFIDSRQERAFARRAEAISLRYAPVSRIEGFNLSGGRSITVAVYRSEDQ